MKHQTLNRIIFVLLTAALMSACASPLPQTGATEPVETQPTVLVTETAASTTEPPETSEPSSTPTSPSFVPAVAYIGLDGNVWLTDTMGEREIQITVDAVGYSLENTPVVSYQRPKWSSDGLLLGYERQEGKPSDSGYTFSYSFWIYDASKNETKVVLQEEISSFDWKPGTHQIAYSPAIDPGYFGRLENQSELAKGIQLLDVDSGELTELVKPERGYHLVMPKWSPDGRFISFQEAYLPEGSGKFAYYDLDVQEYIAWDEPIGLYTWSADSKSILYDTLTYTPQGNEAIYSRPLSGGEASQVSPEIDGYAYYPVVSENGELVAYFADLDGPDNGTSTLFYMETANGEPVSLGVFKDPGFLSFTPGWAHLLMTSGPWDNAEILLISPAQGTVTVLARGSQPTWNPALPLQ